MFFLSIHLFSILEFKSLFISCEFIIPGVPGLHLLWSLKKSLSGIDSLLSTFDTTGTSCVLVVWYIKTMIVNMLRRPSA